MKIAYLILAHKSPKQLARLVKRLNVGEVLFFIHINVAVEISAFKAEMENTNPGMENIFFLEKRYKTRWGGFRAVKATMALIAASVSHEPEVVCFISGQDYPIKNNLELKEFFKRYKEKILIEHEKIDVSRPSRISYYHFPDYIDYKKAAFSNRNIPLVVRVLNKVVPIRKPIEGVIPYVGRVQFTMPLEVARFVVEEHQRNKKLNQFYKFVLIPDEQYLHTLLLNSRFASRVLNLRTSFADYNAPHPVVWRSQDLEFLKKQETPFARKFDIEVDEYILDLIDHEI